MQNLLVAFHLLYWGLRKRPNELKESTHSRWFIYFAHLPLKLNQNQKFSLCRFCNSKCGEKRETPKSDLDLVVKVLGHKSLKNLRRQWKRMSIYIGTLYTHEWNTYDGMGSMAGKVILRACFMYRFLDLIRIMYVYVCSGFNKNRLLFVAQKATGKSMEEFLSSWVFQSNCLLSWTIFSSRNESTFCFSRTQISLSAEPK